MALITCGAARPVEPTYPGQALNDRNPLTIVDPVWIDVPPAFTKKEARALPGGDSIIVMVTIAVDREGRVVDAEGHPPSVTRVGSGVAEDLQELMTEEQVGRFRETGRQAALRSRFRPRDHAVLRAGELVRAQVSFIWRVHRAPIDLYRHPPTRRFGDVLLSRMETRYENPVMMLLAPYGLERRHQEVFDPDAPIGTPEDRGVPADRFVSDDTVGCGLREKLPEDLAVPVGRWVSSPTLIPESKAEPEWPDDARTLRVRGKVTLAAWLDKTGAIRAVTVVRGTPAFPSFAESAIDAVCQWRYEPARRVETGVPLDSRFTIYVSFELY